jgi:SAM-dependent methyltransferase
MLTRFPDARAPAVALMADEHQAASDETHSTAADLRSAMAYENGLVPALMQEWPARLIAAASIQPGGRVLDVACGTGVLARAVADAVGPSGTVVGLDLDRGMLRVALARRPGVWWVQGSATHLPLATASFDAVVSQFGLMFFADKPRALREMWRVLRPGGRVVVAVWASLEATPAYATETELVERLAGSAASAPLRLPFGLGDPAVVSRLFEAAAVPLASVTCVVGRACFPSIRAMVEADLVGWLPLMGVQLAPHTIAAILDEAEVALAPYRQSDGSVAFDSPANVAVSLPAPA